MGFRINIISEPPINFNTEDDRHTDSIDGLFSASITGLILSICHVDAGALLPLFCFYDILLCRMILIYFLCALIIRTWPAVWEVGGNWPYGVRYSSFNANYRLFLLIFCRERLILWKELMMYLLIKPHCTLVRVSAQFIPYFFSASCLRTKQIVVAMPGCTMTGQVQTGWVRILFRLWLRKVSNSRALIR